MPRNVKVPALQGLPGTEESHRESSQREDAESLGGAVACRPHGNELPLERMLFTADEVANSLAISQSLIRQLTLMNALPCRRIGRLVRYTPSDVQAFISQLDERNYR